MEEIRNGVIMLDDQFCIDVLPIDYALAKIRKGKDGKERKDHIAFYGSIRKCLKEYVKQAVHNDLSETAGISLQEALETVQQAVSRCYRVINAKFPEV